MTNQPETAWVEAARIAAAKTHAALGAVMESIQLDIPLVSEAEAAATNSLDRSFLDYLKNGEHLTERFLANAR